jgi:hypothetical protein
MPKGKGSRRHSLSQQELQLARDMGAATYLSSYIWLMAQQLGVTVQEEITNDAVNAMAELMVEPLNFATQAAFCMLMEDERGAREQMAKLHNALTGLKRT